MQCYLDTNKKTYNFMVLKLIYFFSTGYNVFAKQTARHMEAICIV